jgi:hypothetical protein
MVKPVSPLPAEGPRETGLSPLKNGLVYTKPVTEKGANGLNGLTF